MGRHDGRHPARLPRPRSRLASPEIPRHNRRPIHRSHHALRARRELEQPPLPPPRPLLRQPTHRRTLRPTRPRAPPPLHHPPPPHPHPPARPPPATSPPSHPSPPAASPSSSTAPSMPSVKANPKPSSSTTANNGST